MFSTSQPDGTKLAYVADEGYDAQTAPSTLQDLSVVVTKTGGKQAGMLQSTLNQFLRFLNKHAEETPIEMLESEREAFVQHLRSGAYKPSSVRSYSNYVSALLNIASKSGWVAPLFEVPKEWRNIWDVADAPSSREIIRFAVKLGKKPNNLSEDDLTAWRLDRVKAGHKLSGRDRDCSIFRMTIKKAGLSAEFPLIKRSQERYGVSLAAMVPTLRMEIEELVDWKVSAFQPGRPRKAHVRTITAEGMTDHLCRMTGYVQNILGKPPVTSLRDLVTPDNITRYVTWTMNKRKLQGPSVVIGLGMVQAALGHHPNYKDLDLSWMTTLAAEMPFESEQAIAERKSKKYISYAEADAIPGRIHAHRKRQKHLSAHDHAASVRDELLMSWLVILPWRQRNIRECRIGGEVPNLFKAPISPFSMVTAPKWVTEQEKSSPGGSYWQFRFSKDETKTGNEVHSFLPFDLVGILEEYLETSRKTLVSQGSDSVTLFVDDRGMAMNLEQLRDRVRSLAAMHAGAPTTPHLFRDIVAYEWLLTHPEDYLTLSKILWHRNVNTTLKKYARRFDESTGCARMDDWRAARRTIAA
jgi:integrase